MNYEDLHDRVGQLIAEAVWNCGNDCIRHGEDANTAATAAISAVIKALAQEADRLDLGLLQWQPTQHVTLALEPVTEPSVADWLRSHLETTQ